MYQDRRSWSAYRIERTIAPGCGTETEVSVATRSGRVAASAHATAEPQSCPTRCTRPRPRVSTSATTSCTSRLIRYDERPRGRAPRE